MPYKRVGKCIYKKNTNKKVGCSSSISKAKKYLTTLHINASKEEEEYFSKVYEQLIQYYVD
jgi:hypothetical protein